MITCSGVEARQCETDLLCEMATLVSTSRRNIRLVHESRQFHQALASGCHKKSGLKKEGASLEQDFEYLNY